MSDEIRKSSAVVNYGWSDSTAAESCGYIAPAVVRILEAHLSPSSRVCDVGCGNGALIKLLSRDYKNLVGIEYDREGFELARALNPDCLFYNLGVEDDPGVVVQSEGDRFDAVVSTEVIEHLFAPHLLLKFARQILKPNGLVVISTPYHGYLKNLALSVADKWDDHHTPLWHGGHIKFFSKRTLSLMLTKNGFTVEGFWGVGRFPYMWKSMIICARLDSA